MSPESESVWRVLAADEFPLLAAALVRGRTVLCYAVGSARLDPENWLTAQPRPDDGLDALTYTDERLLAALPLMVKGETFGVLLVEETSGGRRFRSRRLAGSDLGLVALLVLFGFL